MSGKAEHICNRHTGPLERRFLKRKLRRARRRLEKARPEDAPTKTRELTRGWSN